VQISNSEDPKNEFTRYSIFQNGIYGGPSIGKAGQINLSLGSNLEMKYKKHTDSGAIYNKLTLIERFTVSTSYNLAADSFQWAYISLTGNTTLFKKLGVNYSATIDPYPYNLEGGDVNDLLWKSGEGIGRIVSSDLSFTTTLTGSSTSQNKDKSNNTTTNSNSSGSGLQLTSPDKYFDYENGHPEFYAPLSINTWSITGYYNILSSNNGIVKQTTQSLTFNGSAQITKFWYGSIYTGYDFVGHQFTPTSISLKRDMHCWEMIFTTIPFGFHQSFMVDIHVKSSILKDLKLTRHRDWYDNQVSQ
jgi:hypothetical protein